MIKKVGIFIFIFLIFTGVGYTLDSDLIQDSRFVKVIRIMDGATLKIITKDGKIEIVKLIGVDPPVQLDSDANSENNYFFNQSVKFCEEWLKDKEVRLVQDRMKRDGDGNLLGYIWVKDDLFNEKIIENGWAYFYISETDDCSFKEDYINRLKMAEERAIEKGVGIWSLIIEKTDESATSAQPFIIDPPQDISHDSLAYSQNPAGPNVQSQSLASSNIDKVKVVRVVDGDTFHCQFADGQTAIIRLMGIDTPETVHPTKKVEFFGKEASDYTKTNLENQDVLLTYDLNRKDRYGRILAYVWLNGILFNNKIIREGYAYAYLKYPFKYMNQFRKSQRYAMLTGKGLWRNYSVKSDKIVVKKEVIPPQSSVASPDTPPTAPPSQAKLSALYVGNKKSKKFHKIDCRFADEINPENLIEFKSREEALQQGYTTCKICNP